MAIGASELKADWTSHHIEGIARVNGQYFEAPLISHVEGNLWQGGCINGVTLDDDFVQVVSLYPWEKYNLFPGTERLEIKMYDSHEGIEFQSLLEASTVVLEGLRKGKTLVHCQAGLNRSGLVAAFTLMRLGRTAQEAIDLLRRSRSPQVLCNSTFVKQLHDLQHKFELDDEFAKTFRA